MMRRTIRHVAGLAVAVVMLTAIAVPAQGEGGGGGETWGGENRRYCASWVGDCYPDAWATINADTYRVLQLEVESEAGVEVEEASGTGQLLVSHEDLEGDDAVIFLLFKLDKKGLLKLAASVECDVRDPACRWPRS
jgi:hypothetical protein